MRQYDCHPDCRCAIQQLIDDKEPEGRYLEYKRDIPISDEEQKQARGAGRGDPQDRSWLQNRPLRAFGRDKLMEELVAFANALTVASLSGGSHTSEMCLAMSPAALAPTASMT